MDLPSFVYYTKRPALKVGDVDSAARLLLDHDDIWMISGTQEWEELRTRFPDLCVAAQRPLFAAKAADVLSGQPPAEVLLLTRGRNCTK